MGCAALNGINMGPGNGHQTTAGNARMTPMRRQERNTRRGCGLRLIAGAAGVLTAVLTLAVPLSAQRAERPAPAPPCVRNRGRQASARPAENAPPDREAHHLRHRAFEIAVA